MSPVVITLLVIAGIILLLVFWLIAVYNGLVVSRNRFKNAFSRQGLHGPRAGNARSRHQGPKQRVHGLAEGGC